MGCGWGGQEKIEEEFEKMYKHNIVEFKREKWDLLTRIERKQHPKKRKKGHKKRKRTKEEKV